MSNMQFSETSFTSGVEILNRLPFEGIPMTLDFTSVTDKVNGKKIVKAGTPIGASGTADNTATVVGILLDDVIEDRPQGTLVKKGYINTKAAQTYSGVTYASQMKAALPMVVFENVPA